MESSWAASVRGTVIVAGRSTKSLASMAKRKLTKSTVARRKSGVGAPSAKSTTAKRRRNSGKSAAVQAAYEKTRRRILEIEKRALSKLRGGNTNS